MGILARLFGLAEDNNKKSKNAASEALSGSKMLAISYAHAQSQSNEIVSTYTQLAGHFEPQAINFQAESYSDHSQHIEFKEKNDSTQQDALGEQGEIDERGEQEGEASSGVTDMVPEGEEQSIKEKVIQNELRKFLSTKRPALRIKLSNIPHDLKDFIGQGGILKVRNGCVEYYPFSMQYVSSSAKFNDIKRIVDKLSSALSVLAVEGSNTKMCKIATGILANNGIEIGMKLALEGESNVPRLIR